MLPHFFSSRKFFTSLFILFITLVLLFTSHTLFSQKRKGETARILVRIEASERNQWEDFLSTHPIPRGFLLEESSEAAYPSGKQEKGGQEPVIAAITLRTTGPRQDSQKLPNPDQAILKFLQEQGAEESKLRDARILNRLYLLRERPLVPVVPYWDSRTSVSLAESNELPLRLVQDIGGYEKGLAIENLHIDSPEYPLFEKTILQIQWFEQEDESWPFLSDELYPRFLDWLSRLEKYRVRESAESAGTTDRPAPGSSPGPESSPTGASYTDLPEARDVRWIAGVGDLMLQRGIEDVLISRGESGLKYIFQDTLPILRDQDYLIGNLEGAVSSRGTPTPKSYNFRFRPEVLGSLKAAGFDYLSLTNNHCYDYGEVAFTDTLAHLDRYGIATSGAGHTPSDAYRPYRGDLRGMPLHILSVAAYPQERNGFDGRSQASVSENRAGVIFSGPKTLESIRDFAGPESIDVVVVHGGQEWTSRPTAEQKESYRSFIDAGADIVFGHHPHVLQGIEAYKDGLIAYSLGNFLFPGMGGMAYAEDTVILSVGFVGEKAVYVEAHPVKIDNHRIALEKGGDAILSRYLFLSRQLSEEAAEN